MRIEFDKEVDGRDLAGFLESQLRRKFSAGKGVITVDVDLKPSKVKELLKRFLHRSGYKGYKVVSDPGKDVLRIKRVKEEAREKRRRKGSYAPPPSSSLPYFFPE